VLAAAETNAETARPGSRARAACQRGRNGVQAHRVRTQTRWRAVNAPHLVALVRAGARFNKGNSSNDPTNQEVTSKSRDTPIHKS
jgi:hypothetical protein